MLQNSPSPMGGGSLARRRSSLAVCCLVAAHLFVFEAKTAEGLFMLRPIGPGSFRWLRSPIAATQKDSERRLEDDKKLPIIDTVLSESLPPIIGDDESRINRRTVSESRNENDEFEGLFEDLNPVVAQIGVVMPVISGTSPLVAASGSTADMEDNDNINISGYVRQNPPNDEEDYLVDVIAMMRHICSRSPAAGAVAGATTVEVPSRVTRGQKGGIMFDKIELGGLGANNDPATQALVARFCHHAPMVRNG